MFLNFWPLKPYVLIYFALIENAWFLSQTKEGSAFANFRAKTRKFKSPGIKTEEKILSL